MAGEHGVIRDLCHELECVSLVSNKLLLLLIEGGLIESSEG